MIVLLYIVNRLIFPESFNTKILGLWVAGNFLLSQNSSSKA